jgi:hypothetical protein
MKLELSGRFFKEISNVKCHENPSSWSRVVPYGRTDTHIEGRTDMTTLIDALGNFANAPKTLRSAHTAVFMCFVWISEQTAIIQH